MKNNGNCTELCTAIESCQRISREDAQYLYDECDLKELSALAEFNRRKFNPGDTVTYLVDRNVNYTNVCSTRCTFCGFYRPTSHSEDSYVISMVELGDKISEALDIGATRVLLQGGHNDDLPYSYYIDLVSWIAQNFQIDINAFSPSEIKHIAKKGGKTHEETLVDLKQAGLTGLPGGGAEILDDEIRSSVSPRKIMSDEWISIMEIAQSLDLVTTATMVIGFGENTTHRINHLDKIRKLQDRTIAAGRAGFTSFISWPLQLSENTSMGRSRHRDRYGANADEYLRNLAVARIFLDNIPHHQTSWPTLGPEVAQTGLHYGGDDFGSTMMEENVVSQAGAPTQVRCCMMPEEIRAHIRNAGFIPAERTAAFEIVKVYEDEQD